MTIKLKIQEKSYQYACKANIDVSEGRILVRERSSSCVVGYANHSAELKQNKFSNLEVR